MRLLCTVVALWGLAQPALAECDTRTVDCNPDILIHPLPGDANRQVDDPSLYSDPAMAPSEDDGEVLAPTDEEEDTPDIDPTTFNTPPE